MIVLVHGGTCTAHNFDVSPANTASTAADHLSLPIVCINRPGYLDSTQIEHVPEGSTYHQTVGGQVYHEHMLPMVWERYAKPAGCTSLVLMAHSMGSMGIVVAAGLHSLENVPKYPLSGIIFSGWGHRYITPGPKFPTTPEEELAWKQLIMCSYPEKHLVDPEIIQHIQTQHHSMPKEDRSDLVEQSFREYWPKYAGEITVPVFFAVGEDDRFWEGSDQHIKEYEKMFPKCPRFDGSVVLGAPHAIEWSYFAQGWYARCFGFAAEVAAWHGLQADGSK